MKGIEIIYTLETNCQDCYKCIRECPTKAIKIINHKASVVHDLCVYCGLCVEICPAKAKKVRRGFQAAKMLVEEHSNVIASIAPTYIAEFSAEEQLNLINALKHLGFKHVSETALGAEIVSKEIVNYINNSENKIHITTACPSIVRYIGKYFKDLTKYLTEICSPMIAHSKMLKSIYGENTKVVFIGPCIAKKTESDENNEYVELALTFKELREWFASKGVSLKQNTIATDNEFSPCEAGQARLYPIDGGMIGSTKSSNEVVHMSFSGLKNVKQILEQIDKLSTTKKILLELTACEGSCIAGPGFSARKSIAIHKQKIEEHVKQTAVKPINLPQVNTWQSFSKITPTNLESYSEVEIKEALSSVGKQSEKDELNCSGCGYDSCKDFAIGMLSGIAESSMCVSFMRKLADNKANVLLHKIPAGVVLVDENLKIIEANRYFAKLMGKDIEDLYEIKPGLKGGDIKKMLSFHKIISAALNMHEAAIERDINEGKKRFSISVFTVQQGKIVCAIIRDLFVPEVRKEEVIKRTKQVIQSNLETVQQIAYLLGENASRTEHVLNSIVESYYSTSKE